MGQGRPRPGPHGAKGSLHQGYGEGRAHKWPWNRVGESREVERGYLVLWLLKSWILRNVGWSRWEVQRLLWLRRSARNLSPIVFVFVFVIAA